MELTQETFADTVRKWVQYDTLIGTLLKQAANARKIRESVEEGILQYLNRNSLRNAIIQIAGGRLTVHEEKHSQPISLKLLEELLHGYYASVRRHDETKEILTYLKENRTYTTVTKLKKS
jgi:hypothetical protein